MPVKRQDWQIDFDEDAQHAASSAEILIVEDLYDNLALLDRVLTEQGYQVRVARDGPSGLRAAQTQPPDLILLDVRLPKMDGFEVCAELKATQALRDIPVLVINNEAEGEEHLTKQVEGLLAMLF